MVATASSEAAPALVTLDEARARMLEGVMPLPVEEAALDEALGLVLGEPLSSLLTLPPWDNSAMDGFAVRAADVAGASRAMPVRLPVTGEVAAGRVSSITVEPGSAVRILTGAPLPSGADSVVPVEDTDAPMGAAELPASVTVFVSAMAGAHIRRAGGDLRVGQALLDRGTPLTPAVLALIAAAGYGRVPIHRRPRVTVLATGDELVPAGVAPGPAQIADSNSIGLAALAREIGADVRVLGIARDSLEDVLAHLRDGLVWADVVVVSGGVSVGAHDVVRDAFAALGRIELWRVAVQPGKPVAFGRAPASGRAGDVLLFGLPGNPVSSQVTFELFVRPVLRRMAGHADVIGREVVRARLGQPVAKARGRRAFLRVRLTHAEDGWRADLTGGQESHMLSALAAADGLAVIPESTDALEAGAEVEVIRIR